jgi:hypothetical protein
MHRASEQRTQLGQMKTCTLLSAAVRAWICGQFVKFTLLLPQLPFLLLRAKGKLTSPQH